MGYSLYQLVNQLSSSSIGTTLLDSMKEQLATSNAGFNFEKLGRYQLAALQQKLMNVSDKFM